jgi:hypothetical protein
MAPASPNGAVRTTITRSTTYTSSTTRRYVSVVGKNGDGNNIPLRFQHLVFQLFVAVLALVLVGLHLLVQTHDRYIQPYLKNIVQWNPDRSEDERTYPVFLCDGLTASDGAGITIPRNTSVDAALDHMLHHGGGLFPGLLEEQLLWDLRDYILWKNERLAVTENIPVISFEKRHSFAFDVQDVPLVVELLEQLSKSNPLLEQVLQGLLGPNPAMVELSQITVKEGAEDQYWHHDTAYEDSAPTYGRSYQHLYTLLIPMQDTVTTMGSTWVAPGSHYCGTMDQYRGFPVAGTDIWKAGDGLLYSSALKHRGGGHTLGPDRTVLIISFTNRPDGSLKELSDHYQRSLPQGPVFAIRYDHWGFTWQDLKTPQTTLMAAPYLRAFGIYKLPASESSEWGWTYLRSLGFRMMHEQGGYQYIDLQAVRKIITRVLKKMAATHL